MKTTLKKIKIQKFKIHNLLEIDFGEKTEIWGKNQVGKSSVVDALRCVLFPKKSDKDKVQGEGPALIQLLMDYEGQPLEISTTIKKDGSNRRKVLLDGFAPQNPSAFLKDLVAFGTFNPREMIGKEGREERLLRLLPIKLKKSDFVEWPIQTALFKWDEHAFKVFEGIEKNIRTQRLNKYQEKETHIKGYEKIKNELKLRKENFLKNYPEKIENPATILEDKGKNEEKARQKQKGIYALENQIQALIAKKKADKQLLEKKHTEVNNLKLQIERAELARETAGKEILESETKIRKGETFLQNEKVALEKINQQNALFEKKAIAANELNGIKGMEGTVDTFKKEAESSFKEWKKLDDFIKKDVRDFRASLLKPIQEKIPNFSLGEENQLLYKGVPLDEVSESESIELALKFMGIENKSSFLCVDEGEALDSNTVKGIKWPKNSILVRVSDSPLNETWKSIEIKK